MITYDRMPKYFSPSDFVHYKGGTFTVEWYYTELGEMPAREYYDALSEIDQMRLDYVIKHMADKPIGTMLPKTLYRVEDKDNKIYAFKPRSERFFNFTTQGKKIIITNAYHKHSQKMTRVDLEELVVAVRYRHDYLRRVTGGTYYERKT